MAEPHDALDAPQLGQFGLTDGGTVVHGGLHAGVDAHPFASGLEPVQEIRHVLGRRNRLELPDEDATGVHEELVAGLEVGAVKQPGVARHDPADVVGVHTLLEQPQAGIDAGLARPDHHVAGLRLGELDEVVQGNAANIWCHGVPGWRCRRHLRAGVGGIHDLLAYLHRLAAAGEQGLDLVGADHLALREEAHPA